MHKCLALLALIATFAALIIFTLTKCFQGAGEPGSYAEVLKDFQILIASKIKLIIIYFDKFHKTYTSAVPFQS